MIVRTLKYRFFFLNVGEIKIQPGLFLANFKLPYINSNCVALVFGLLELLTRTPIHLPVMMILLRIMPLSSKNHMNHIG